MTYRTIVSKNSQMNSNKTVATDLYYLHKKLSWYCCMIYLGHLKTF